MDRDRTSMLAFFGALLLLVIMLVSTIVNLNKISKTFKKLDSSDSENNVQSSNVIVSNTITEDNIVIKTNSVNNNVYDEEDE